jgi:hypothetical protein
MSINGSASNKAEVAAFVDRLGSVKGIAAPLPAMVQVANNKLTFTVTTVLTSDALSGKYSAVCAPKGGK